MQRFTVVGIVNLFSECAPVAGGDGIGPASATVLTLREFFAIALSFNSKLVYDVLKVFFGYLFYPLKFLDYFLVSHRCAFMIASSVFFVGRRASVPARRSRAEAKSQVE